MMQGILTVFSAHMVNNHVLRLVYIFFNILYGNFYPFIRSFNWRFMPDV